MKNQIPLSITATEPRLTPTAMPIVFLCGVELSPLEADVSEEAVLDADAAVEVCD